MRVLITGGQGMLGRTLARQLGGDHEVWAAGRGDCDVTNAGAVARAFAQFTPQVVLHCAAMTDVDVCERRADRAYQVNQHGSANIAKACQRAGARLIAFSTDYVFNGRLDRPYHEDDIPDPCNVYGRSKLAGETSVRMYCENHLILRIAWLYGQGGPSFVHTMLRLGSQSGPPIRVVDDQVGNPTCVDAVAERVSELLRGAQVGIWHLAAEGDATRYELACAIARLVPFQREILACSSADVVYPAKRPANSRLANRQLARQGHRPMRHWHDGLQQFLEVSLDSLLCRPAA